MSDDSSSEDEIMKRILKDSIDTDLMTNDLYNNSTKVEKPLGELKSTNFVQTKPSLRYIMEDDGHDHNFIKVTPEFQDFVAKHLFKHLESQIIEKKSKHKKKPMNNANDNQKGIHLFNGSPKLLNSVIDEPMITTKRKCQHKTTSYKVILERASETAVSPEWILNKGAIKGWKNMNKGKIMEVKSNNDGTFDIVNDEI